MLIVCRLAGDDAWSRTEAMADPATYSPISRPDDPARVSARNLGSPVLESVSRCAIRDCPDLAERVNASRLVSRAKARYVAWNAPWWAADSSDPAKNTGFSDDVLIEVSTTDCRSAKLSSSGP